VEKSTISIGTHSHQSLTLTQFGDPAEAYKIIRELWMQRRTSSSGSVAAKTVSNVQFKAPLLHFLVGFFFLIDWTGWRQ